MKFSITRKNLTGEHMSPDANAGAPKRQRGTVTVGTNLQQPHEIETVRP